MGEPRTLYLGDLNAKLTCFSNFMTDTMCDMARKMSVA